jgi:hypothetical protein
MADITQLSDADLIGALGQPTQPTFADRFDAVGGAPQAAPNTSLSAMSDGDLMKALGQQQPEVSTTGDMAKSLGIGAAKGVIGLAGLPGTVADLATRGYDWATGSHTNDTVGPYAQTIGPANIQKHIEDYTGKFYEPKTTAGEYAQTVGEFLPGVVGGPGSIATRLATNVLAPAVVSETAGQLTKGSSYEPWARVGGAMLGAALPRAVSRVISPATIDADRAAAVQGLANQGVTDMTAGMKTGNKAIQYAQSENAAAADAAANVNTLKQLTGSVMRRAGVPDELNTGQAVPEVLAANRANLSDQFGSLLGQHDAIPINGFNTEAAKIVNEFKNGTNAADAPALQYFINKVNQGVTEAPAPLSAWPQNFQNIVGQLRKQGVGDTDIGRALGIEAPAATKAASMISGQAYQNIQSEIGKALKSSYGTPGLTTALGELKDALDSSVAGGLKAAGKTADFEKLQALRGQWRDQNILEKAITNSGEYGAQHGVVTPSALYNAVNAVSPRRTAVALNSTPLAGLARDAKAVIGNITPPQSGTSPRLAARLIPAAGAGIVGALIGGPHVGMGAAGAMLAPMVASHTYGKALMSAPIQRYLANQTAVALRELPLRNAAITSALLAGAPASIGSRQ